MTFVIVVWHARPEELVTCLTSLKTEPCTVVVVDVSNDHGAVRIVRSFPEVSWLDGSRNAGYGWACNLGLKYVDQHADTDQIVIFSNADVVFSDGCVRELAAVASDTGGLVAPLQMASETEVSPDSLLPLPTYGASLSRWLHIRRNQRSQSRQRTLGAYAGRPSTYEVSSRHALSGACLAGSGRLLTKLGGFDEAFFLYEEDVDLSVRCAEAGHPLILATTARILHTSGTNKRALSGPAMASLMRSERLLYQKLGRKPAIVRAIQMAGILLRCLSAVQNKRFEDARIWFSMIWRVEV